MTHMTVTHVEQTYMQVSFHHLVHVKTQIFLSLKHNN